MNPASIIRKLNLALLLVLLACACALSLGFARAAWAGEDEPLKDATPAFSGETASSNDDIKGSNWMSGLSDDVALSDLSIPGTHDAGTWITWDGLFYSECQSMPIGNWEYDYYPVAYPVQDAEKACCSMRSSWECAKQY